MTVKCIKMINGEEVLSDVINETKDFININNSELIKHLQQIHNNNSPYLNLN